MSSEIMNESILRKKTEMYAMLIAIESDFIKNFSDKLTLDDISPAIIAKSKKVENEKNRLLSVLRGLDIQSYIEICNNNIEKLNIDIDAKRFINSELNKIIPIRNAVMHPRPLGFYDYVILKQAFDEINTKLTCFTWNSVNKTDIQIKKDPDSLCPPPNNLKKSNKIIENLPVIADYEETSFIGRKKEIGELKAQLNRRNVNILSIIGDGGVGKTTIALKLLYELLDDENSPFELIIWSSLKTNELSNDEFVEISDAICSVSHMYTNLIPFIGSEPMQDPKEWIIELAKNFNTLFVLDNLETINTSEIKDFFDEFSEYGKVLITSRIGLGEMEYRYKLNGLNDEDVEQYTDTLLELYGYECMYTNEEKSKIIKDELHSNPLAIKWFVRCLYNGQKTNDILAHKDDVINFCMANVYDKLSETAHRVLDILTISSTDLSFPEIMYYLDCTIDEDIKINYAINELGKCNFISEEKFKLEKRIAVTDFAHEFLQLRFSSARPLLAKFKEKEQILKSFGQQMQIRKSYNCYDINSIYFSDKGELVSAYYLSLALKYRNTDIDKSLNYVKYAKVLISKYFECNLIAATIYGPTSPLKATEEYKLAIKFCKQTEEKVCTYIHYADFLIRFNNYYEAINILEDAEKLNPECIEIKFEKVKALSCIGDFNKADNILNELEQLELTENNYNKLLTKQADVLKRRSEQIDYRETQRKLSYLNQAFKHLEKSKNPDKLLYDYMATVICEVAYLYSDSDAREFILEKIPKYFRNIKASPKFKVLRTYLKERKGQIEDEYFWEKIKGYLINYNECLYLLKDNEGLVYNIKEGYGFCKNNYYENGIYFSMQGLPQNITYGDIIEYTAVIVTKSGPAVVNPHIVGNIEERLP